MTHPLDPIPDPDPATTLIQSSTRVVSPENAKDECLKVALKACLATVEAFDDLFGQCCSNPIFDSWGNQVNCTKLNYANQFSREAVELGAKLNDAR